MTVPKRTKVSNKLGVYSRWTLDDATFGRAVLVRGGETYAGAVTGTPRSDSSFFISVDQFLESATWAAGAAGAASLPSSFPRPFHEGFGEGVGY